MKDNKKAEDKLMNKVAGLMEDAGVFTGGQEALPSADAQRLRQVSLPYNAQLQKFLSALQNIKQQSPALDVRINKIQAAISQGMNLAGI
jgi:hypothetical protein